MKSFESFCLYRAVNVQTKDAILAHDRRAAKSMAVQSWPATVVNLYMLDLYGTELACLERFQTSPKVNG